MASFAAIRVAAIRLTAIRFITTPLAGLALLLASLPVAAAAATRDAIPAPPPHIAMPGVRTAATYAITDLGTFSSVNQNHPIALNNSGQILGDVLTAQKFDCVLWNGSRLVDVTASNAYSSCGAATIGDVDATTGAFTFTGAISLPYQDSGTAFVATAKPNATAAAFSIYQQTSESSIFGHDTSGVWLMTAFDAGVIGDTIPFTLTGSTPAPLQPQCIAKTLRYCLTLDYFYDGSCPFGKCYLSSGGLILGYDSFNLNLMTYRLGTANSGKDLPIHLPRYAQMNDKEQVAYDQTDNAGHRHVYVYDTKTATQKVLPAVAGNVCDYQLVSQNNVGSVLGLATNCTRAPSEFYVLWDAAGTHNVTAGLPANTYFSISLLGVNDNGVMLAELLKTNAQDVLEYHWGFIK